MPDESAADDGESSGDDVSQLRDIVAKQHSRINQLEQQVAALDEEPTIGRRGIVGTIAAAVGLGGLAGYGSQQASAQASGPAGQQGTPEEPNDMYAWDLDVQNGAAFNGNPLTGVGALDVDELNGVVYVDDSIQEAVNDAGEGGTVIVPPGTYNEQVVMEDDQTLIGLSKESVLIDGTDGMAVSVQDGCVLKSLSAQNNVSDSNAVLRTYGSDHFIENIHILDGWRGIQIGSPQVIFKSCRVEEMDDYEIRLTGSAENCSIESNIVNGVISDGGTNTSVGDGNVLI